MALGPIRCANRSHLARREFSWFFHLGRYRGEGCWRECGSCHNDVAHLGIGSSDPETCVHGTNFRVSTVRVWSGWAFCLCMVGGACTMGRFSDRLVPEDKSAATVGYTMVAFFMRCG